MNKRHYIKKFTDRFIYEKDEGDGFVSYSLNPDEVLSDIESFLSSVIDEVSQEAKKEVIERVDKYFEGLIVIADPQKTRKKLLIYLSQPQKEKECICMGNMGSDASTLIHLKSYCKECSHCKETT